jgi:hypothetical protein
LNKVLGGLRGLLGIGLIWAILRVALAMTVGTLIGVIDPDDIGPGEEPIVLAPMIGPGGFICGVVFGSLLSIVERRKIILELPLMRAAMWGILVAAVLPLVMGKGLPEMMVTSSVGAVSAVASVAMVRNWVEWRSRVHSRNY